MHDGIETIETKATLSGATWAGYETPSNIPARPARLMLQDLMPQVESSASGISYAQVTSIPAPPVSPIPDGTIKTDAAFVGSHKQAKMRKSAFWQKVAYEFWQDSEVQTGFTRSVLALGLAKAIEQNIISEFIAAGLTEIAPSGTLDDIQTAKSHIHEAGYEPNGVVISPNDFENLRSGEGMTQGDGPFGYGDKSELGKVYFDRVLNLPVVESSAIADGTILVGAFNGASMLFKRTGPPTVTDTDSNEDDFVKNLITVRIEQRAATAIFALPAFRLITAP